MTRILDGRNSPFCWQEKDVIRKIQSYDLKKEAISIYTTLTLIASDNGSEIIEEYGIVLMEKAGIGRDTLRIILNQFVDDNITLMERLPATKEKMYGKLRIELLSLKACVQGKPQGSPKGKKKSLLEDNKEIKELYRTNVKLFPKEFKKLVEELGAPAVEWILDKLSKYKEDYKKQYASDYGAIRKRVIDAYKKEHTTKDTRMKKPNAYGNFNTEIEMYNRYLENDRRTELFEMYGRDYVMGVMARKAQNAKMQEQGIDKQYRRKIEDIQPLPFKPPGG